jgi:ABC transport system ATP-binding/permease protein
LILVSHDRDFLDRVATSVLVAEGDGRWVEYAGGYSDMLTQRGQGSSGQGKGNKDTPPKPVKQKPEAVSGPPKAKRRLSFKEKHALETLPARIDDLRSRAARLQEVLNDADLYARDPKTFAQTTQAMAKIAAALAEAEDEWLELEILRQDIEA